MPYEDQMQKQGFQWHPCNRIARAHWFRSSTPGYMIFALIMMCYSSPYYNPGNFQGKFREDEWKCTAGSISNAMMQTIFMFLSVYCRFYWTETNKSYKFRKKVITIVCQIRLCRVGSGLKDRNDPGRTRRT